jgi:hypothetical protein
LCRDDTKPQDICNPALVDYNYRPHHANRFETATLFYSIIVETLYLYSIIMESLTLKLVDLSTTKLDVHTLDSLHSNGGTDDVGERGGMRKISVPFLHYQI